MKSVLKTIFLLSLICSFAISVNAQIPDSIDGIEISIDPINPSTGQNVDVSIESYITSLNAASIVWLVNSKNIAQGTGLTSIKITSPDIGKSTNVTVIIMTAEGKEIRKSITIKSGDIDLVWESLGYTPPLFKGKSLFSYQNIVKVTAIPHLAGNSGRELDPKTLIYKWEKNDKVVQNQSGYGKQTLTINEEIPRPVSIEVTVSNKDGSEQGTAFMSLEPGNPAILFYEEDPLYGVFYNKSLEEKIRVTKEEISILAVPYFFSTYVKNSPLKYSWGINNLEQPDLSTNQSVTLRTKEGTEGSSDLSLEVRNTDQILQGAKKAVTLFFSSKPVVEENVTF